MKSDRELLGARMECLLVVGSFSVMVFAMTLIVPTEKGYAQTDGSSKKQFRGILGKHSKKILVKDGKTLLWAGGDPNVQDKSQWYDFTGAPMPAEQLQFGIGKDRIKSIDDPLFVKPSDPRLGKLSKGWYRRGKKVSTTDDMRVMGYVINGEARAYPAALLNRHELVNDRFGNKPVTVGW